VSDLCSACHAISAQGESTNERAPPLRTVLSRYDADQLTNVLQSGELMGDPDLPHVYLSEQGARDTVAYLVELTTAER
jgi:cytochrome c553